MLGVAVQYLRHIAANDTVSGVRRGEVAIINALGRSTKPKRCPSNMSCVAALEESLRLDKCSGFRNNRSRRRAFRQLFADPPPRCSQPIAVEYHPGVRACVVITKPGVYVLICRVADPVNLELSCP